MSTVDNTNIVGTKTGPELVTELNTQIGNCDTELDLRPESAVDETITGDWILADIVCNGFTSTGIDDNATGERVDIADLFLTLGVTGATTYTVRQADNDNNLIILGGNSLSSSGMYLYGSTHAQAGDVTFTGGGNNTLQFDYSSSTWDFRANDIVLREKADHSSTPTAGRGALWVKSTTPATLIFTDDAGTDFTLGSGGGGSGDILADGTIPMTASWNMGGFGISNVGTLACTTFTSTGIDDNATGERLQLDDTELILGVAGASYGIASANDAGVLIIAGGTDVSTGANIVLYGSTHATQANDISIRANLVTEAYYDDSASEWDLQGNSLINASAGYNNQTGTTYTIVAADNGKILTFDNAASIAVTLPDTLDTNFQCTIVQVGAGVPTVTPSTDTVNGAGTGVAPSAQWKGMYLSQYSATNWLALL